MWRNFFHKFIDWSILYNIEYYENYLCKKMKIRHRFHKKINFADIINMIPMCCIVEISCKRIHNENSRTNKRLYLPVLYKCYLL